MIDIDQLPLILLIAFLCALGWHFAYLFAYIGAAFQDMTGVHRRFKVWDTRFETAAKKMNENPGDPAAMQGFLDSLVEREDEKDKMPLMEDIRRELWWVEVHLAYPLMNVIWIIGINHWWDVLTSLINIWLNYDWWKNHNHDDRWKKRRKKALSKVKQVAGKLVVVPVPTPA